MELESACGFHPIRLFTFQPQTRKGQKGFTCVIEVLVNVLLLSLSTTSSNIFLTDSYAIYNSSNDRQVASCSAPSSKHVSVRTTAAFDVTQCKRREPAYKSSTGTTNGCNESARRATQTSREASTTFAMK